MCNAMNRRSFLRNISLACVAVSVPFKWATPAVENIEFRGLLWHIQNDGVVVNYNPSSFTIDDFYQLISVYENSNKPYIYECFIW
jgi:hypothetical protein